MSIASQTGVTAIAEELSTEALARIEPDTSAHSVAKQIASSQGLKHVYCDPDSNERLEAGIPTDEELGRRAHAEWMRTDEPMGDALRRFRTETYPAREEIWLSRLRVNTNLKQKILFICGADHIDSFSSLLANNDISFEVLERDWGAT